jgi:hypothetical protein
VQVPPLPWHIKCTLEPTVVSVAQKGLRGTACVLHKEGPFGCDSVTLHKGISNTLTLTYGIVRHISACIV